MGNDLRKNEYPITNNKKEEINIEFKEDKEITEEVSNKKDSSLKNENTSSKGKSMIIDPVDILDKLALIYENKRKNEKLSKK